MNDFAGLTFDEFQYAFCFAWVTLNSGGDYEGTFAAFCGAAV